jgi:hypothetical protein
MGNYSSAIDGIPGIMPGIVNVPSPPEFRDEEAEFTQPKNTKNLHSRDLNNIPQHKRRMMPCNKKDKK